MAIDCASALQGLPESCLDDSGVLLVDGLGIATPSQEFASKSDAGVRDNYIQDIIDRKLVWVSGLDETEDSSGDDNVYESQSQRKILLYRGKTSLTARIALTIEQHKAIYAMSGKSIRLYLGDLSNKIIGSSDGDNFRGADISFFKVSSWKPTFGDTPSFTVMEFQFENSEDLNELLHIVEPSQGVVADRWYHNKLPGLSNVTVEQVGSVAGNELVIDVSLPTSSYTGNDGEAVRSPAVTGLIVANFAATDGSASVSIDTVTEDANIPGRYTIAFTAFSGGTIQVVASLTQTVYSLVLTVS